MLIDTSRLIERGTTWFLRSRRLSDDMAATIAHFTPRVEALAARLPRAARRATSARASKPRSTRYVAHGVPRGARGARRRARHAVLDARHRRGRRRDDSGRSSSSPTSISTCRRGSACRGCARGSRRCRATSTGRCSRKGAMLDDLSGSAAHDRRRGAGRRRRRPRRPARVDRGVAGAESARDRARGAVAGRAARGAGDRCGDAVGRVARDAHARLADAAKREAAALRSGDAAAPTGQSGSRWMLSTHCTFSGFGSTFGRSRFTTTGSWPLRHSTQDNGSVSLALISWCGT